MKKLATTLFILTPFCLAAQEPLTLGDYLSAVKQNNLQYLIEQHNIKIADAETTAQKVFPDPELSFDASEATYSLDFGYMLELGKRNARIKVARNMAMGERAAMEHFYQELRAGATEAFLDAILKKELWQIAQKSFEYMQQLIHSDSIRCASGEISEIDVRQSRMEAITLLNDMLTRKAEYQSAIALLNRFMGRDAKYPIELSENEHIPPMEYPLPDLLQIGKDNRMDIILALRNNETALLMLKLVKAERRPDIGVHIGYERNWKGLIPLREMVTAGISIPLRFSNTNKGAIHSAKFAMMQSELQFQDVRSQVETEITQAYIQYEAAKEKMRHYHSGLLNESQKVLDGIVFRYRRGETGILEVLVAQRTHNDIQAQYFETVKEYHSTLVELQRSCGIWNIAHQFQ